MLTQERKDILFEISKKRPELLLSEKNEVLSELIKLGHKFTLEELTAFKEQMATSNELGFEVLESVSGGAGEGDMEEDSVNKGCINLNTNRSLFCGTW